MLSATVRVNNMDRQVQSQDYEVPTPRGKQLGDGDADEGGGGNGSSESTSPLDGPRVSQGTSPTVVLKVAVPRPADVDGGWIKVKARWHKPNALDRRSLVLWGVPGGSDAGLVELRLRKAGVTAKLRWRGQGVHRHLLAEFGSGMYKIAQEAALREACKAYGIKVAKMRNWATRARHRLLKEAAAPKAKEAPAASTAPTGTAAQASPAPQAPPVTPDVPATQAALKPCKDRVKELRSQLVSGSRRGSVRIGGLNCQGALALNIAEYESFAEQHKFDVLALSDVKLRKGARLSAKGYRVFRQDAQLEDPKSGVVFLVADHLAVAVTKEKCEVVNQLWIRLTGTEGRRDMFLCSAYMPQESASKEDREASFGVLGVAARDFSKTGDVAIIGDLNAKLLTPDDPTERKLIGAYGEQGARNPNGRILLDVMKTAGLTNLLGQRPLPVKAKPAAEVGFWWTRWDKVTEKHHSLDYILVSNQLLGGNSSSWVDYTDLSSDHHLVGANVSCPRDVKRSRGKKAARRRFRLEQMIQKSSKKADVEAAATARDDYEKCLETAFAGYDPYSVTGCTRKCASEQCVCAGIDDFVKRTEAACEQAVGSVPVGRKFSRSWFDDEIKRAITARRKVYTKFLGAQARAEAHAREHTHAHAHAQAQARRDELWREHSRLKRVARVLVKRKKKEDWVRLMETMDQAYKNDHRQLWQLVGRFLPAGKKASLEPVERLDGTLAKTEEQILGAWAEYREKLGTPTPHELEDTDFAGRVDLQNKGFLKITRSMADAVIDREFTKEEIEKVVEALDYHKAGTDDGTLNPMYKCGGATMLDKLCKLFNFLRDREATHPGWQRSTLVNLFKEGERTDPGNYRGIALISCIGKIYLSAWANRLADHAEGSLSEAQGGFRRTRMTADQALTLHEALLRRKREGKDTYLCFIDFRKAFDTVWHNGLWKVLWDAGVRGKAWRVVRGLYASMYERVRLGDKVSKEVRKLQGVRQGCPLSPTLFNYFVDLLAVALSKTGSGLEIYGLDLTSLLYADDVVLMAESAVKLQDLIDVVDKFCRK